MKRIVLMLAFLIAMPVGGANAAPTAEEKAAAEAKKAKAAEAAKRDGELLAKAQDRAVENYKRNQQSTGPTPPQAAKPSQ